MGHAPSGRGPLSLPKDRSCMPGPRGFPAVVCGPEPVTDWPAEPALGADRPSSPAGVGIRRRGRLAPAPSTPAAASRSLSSLVLPKDGREGRS